MRPSAIISIIFSALLVGGCRKESQATRELKDYLHTAFGKTPEDGKAYLLVTDNACKNCVHLNGKNLSARLNRNLYIISPLPKSHFSNFEHYLNDGSDEMDGLKFLDYESKLVIYGQGAVQIVRTVEVIPERAQPVPYCPRN